MPIPAELQSLLSELKISPPTKEHDAVETVEALLAAVTDMDCSFSKNLLIKDKKAGRHGQGPLWQGPSSPPAPPRGAPGGSGRRAPLGGEAGPPGTPPLPPVLELAAASKAADCTGFDLQAGLYLVVVTADRKVDMKVLAGKLGLSGANFRFADAVALKEKLGVEKGAASALAVMNDAAGEPRLLRHATPQPPRLSPHASAATPQLPRLSRHASAATPQLPHTQPPAPQPPRLSCQPQQPPTPQPPLSLTASPQATSRSCSTRSSWARPASAATPCATTPPACSRQISSCRHRAPPG